MKIFLWSKKHKFLDLFSKNIEKCQDKVKILWILFGQFRDSVFFSGYSLDTILGHRKMKSGQLDHLDRLHVFNQTTTCNFFCIFKKNYIKCKFPKSPNQMDRAKMFCNCFCRHLYKNNVTIRITHLTFFCLLMTLFNQKWG